MSRYKKPKDYNQLSAFDKVKVDVALFILNNEGSARAKNRTAAYHLAYAELNVSVPTSQRYLSWYLERYGEE